MANTWTVSATTVEKNSTAITGYVSHLFWFRNSAAESNGEVEVGLVVRVIDASSNAERNDQVAVLPSEISATLDQENSLRPTFVEIRPVAGDTIVVSIADQTITGTVGSAGFAPGNSAGTDPL
jgi:hypothetical protein